MLTQTKRLATRILLVAIATISLPGLSAGGLTQQRQLFVKAEKALKQGDGDEYRKLTTQLTGYPLLPYLKLQELEHNLDSASATTVKSFIKQYDGTPLAYRLRIKWLDKLAREKRWSEILEGYSPTSHKTMRCHYIKALLESGQSAKARELLPATWLSAKSLPDDCDPVFKAMHQSGALTPALVWQRMNLVRGKRSDKRDGLMRYLKNLLPNSEHGYHELWMQSLSNPGRVLASSELNKAHSSRGDLLVHTLGRLGWRQPDKAIAALRKHRKRGHLNEMQQKRVEKVIAKAMTKRKKSGAIAFLDSVKECHKLKGLCEVRVDYAIKQHAWPKVVKWVNEMSPKLQQHEKWGYWKARALAQTGHKAEAKALYKKVAEDRSYYGFLAADKVNAPYRMAHTPVPVGKETIDALAAKPAFQRAIELYRLGRDYPAGAEWRWATKKLDNKGKMAAARLALRWNWHHQAIHTLLPTRYWDDLEIRFPLAYRKLIEQEAKKYDINPAWIYAIIRQESIFNRRARSPVGALGLMQLMPKTAEEVGKWLRMSYLGKADILDPGKNIQLGSRYLKQLHKKFNGWLMLATPSYNAGPHRTDKWLPSKSKPADLWIEEIPFNETRLYVQRVLSYVALYEYRLKKPVVRLRDRMPDVSDRLPSRKSGKKASATLSVAKIPSKKPDIQLVQKEEEPVTVETEVAEEPADEEENPVAQQDDSDGDEDGSDAGSKGNNPFLEL